MSGNNSGPKEPTPQGRAQEVTMSPEHAQFRAELLNRIDVLKIPPELLEKLRTTPILLAGVGTVGGMIGAQLISHGAENLMAADPDKPEISNIVRQASTLADVQEGINKGEAFHRYAMTKNPYARDTIRWNPEGITPQNAAELVSQAEIIVDGVDAYWLEPIIALHREACRQHKVVVTAFDLGGLSFIRVFDYKNKLKKPFGGVEDKIIPVLEKGLAAYRKGLITQEDYRKLANKFNLQLLNPLDLGIEELNIFLNLPENAPHPQSPATANIHGALVTSVIIEILRGNKDLRETIHNDIYETITKQGPKARIQKTLLLIRALMKVNREKAKTQEILDKINAQELTDQNVGYS